MRAGVGTVFFFLLSSLVVFAFFIVFSVLRCRRRFLLPRRQVGVGLWSDVSRWLDGSSNLSSSCLAVLAFFQVFLRPCFRRRFRLLGAGSASVFVELRRFSGLVTIPEAASTPFSSFPLDNVETLSIHLAPMLASNFLLSNHSPRR